MDTRRKLLSGTCGITEPRTTSWVSRRTTKNYARWAKTVEHALPLFSLKKKQKNGEVGLVRKKIIGRGIPMEIFANFSWDEHRKSPIFIYPNSSWNFSNFWHTYIPTYMPVIRVHSPRCSFGEWDHSPSVPSMNARLLIDNLYMPSRLGVPRKLIICISLNLLEIVNRMSLFRETKTTMNIIYNRR